MLIKVARLALVLALAAAVTLGSAGTVQACDDYTGYDCFITTWGPAFPPDVYDDPEC